LNERRRTTTNIKTNKIDRIIFKSQKERKTERKKERESLLLLLLLRERERRDRESSRSVWLIHWPSK